MHAFKIWWYLRLDKFVGYAYISLYQGREKYGGRENSTRVLIRDCKFSIVNSSKVYLVESKMCDISSNSKTEVQLIKYKKVFT